MLGGLADYKDVFFRRAFCLWFLGPSDCEISTRFSKSARCSRLRFELRTGRIVVGSHGLWRSDSSRLEL